MMLGVEQYFDEYTCTEPLLELGIYSGWELNRILSQVELKK
jgi:hypothetical protein